MKNSLKILAAALSAAAVMSCAGVSASADSLKNVNGTMYRYSDSGEKIGKFTGWAKLKDGSRCYYKNGEKLKSCWIAVKGRKTYYIRRNGKAAVGKVKIGGKYYYFESSGKLVCPADKSDKIAANKYGVYIELDNISPKGLNISILREEGKCRDTEVTCGLHFNLEKLNAEGVWEEVKPNPEYSSYVLVALIISSDYTTGFDSNFEGLYYDGLTEGMYRLELPCHSMEDDSRKREKFSCYEYFEI